MSAFYCGMNLTCALWVLVEWTNGERSRYRAFVGLLNLALGLMNLALWVTA